MKTHERYMVAGLPGMYSVVRLMNDGKSYGLIADNIKDHRKAKRIMNREVKVEQRYRKRGVPIDKIAEVLANFSM